MVLRGLILMTRCKEFYIKYKNDPSFCKDKSVLALDAYIKYMDKEFPNWLDNGDNIDLSILHESSIKPMKSLKKTNPEMHTQVKELVCEGLAPNEAIRQVKEAHVKPVVIPENCVNDSIENIMQYLEPETVDLILTDPPYPAEYLPLWSVLAEKAALLLKTGGFLVTYSGQFYLPEIYKMLSEHLEYVWTFALTMSGIQNRVMARNIWNGWKPILVYAKLPYEMEWQTDVLTSPARVKIEHEWQQNIEPVKTLIEKFSLKGQLIVDPFLGSGTTAQAAKELDRQFFGMDTDEGVFRNG